MNPLPLLLSCSSILNKLIFISLVHSKWPVLVLSLVLVLFWLSWILMFVPLLNLTALFLKFCLDLLRFSGYCSSHLFFNLSMNSLPLLRSSSSAFTNHLFSSSVYVDEWCLSWASSFETAWDCIATFVLWSALLVLVPLLGWNWL